MYACLCGCVRVCVCVCGWVCVCVCVCGYVSLPIRVILGHGSAGLSLQTQGDSPGCSGGLTIAEDGISHEEKIEKRQRKEAEELYRVCI